MEPLARLGQQSLHRLNMVIEFLYYKIMRINRNNCRKFSFLVCFLRRNGGVSRRRSATAEFRYNLYGRSTAPSFVNAISPFHRLPTTGAGSCRGTDGRPLPPAGGSFVSGRHGGESFQAKVPYIWWGSPNLAASSMNRTINRT